MYKLYGKQMRGWKAKDPLLVVVGRQLCRTSVCSADPASCALA